MTVRVLSAGAAKGLVSDVTAGFIAETRETIEGVFSAVGVIRERFEGGEACDVLILTARQLSELEAAGLVRPGSVAPIGTVRTAVAVLHGDLMPDISTGSAFATALRAASAVFIPDPMRSTAGIHIRNVLQALGLAEEIGPKLRSFPNGEAAMRALADEAPSRGIGVTQTTEILYTKGLALVGPLPPEHDLSTIYAACVNHRGSDVAAALVACLTGPKSAELRLRSGFE